MTEMHPQSSAPESGASQNTKSTNDSDQKPNTVTPKLKFPSYPPPLILPPLSTHHHTIIILHGRGSTASSFAPPLLSTPIISPSQTLTLRTALPHAKFIFPTASKRRAVLYNRASINQWFDYSSLTEPTTMEREELQIEGLRESSAYIHSLLREEIAVVGAGNVVLGGLSQGCAASLVALLLWEGEALGAAFGMCGWLPFRKQMEEIIARPPYDADDDENDDPFERFGQEEEESDPPTQAIEFLCEEVGDSGVEPSMSFQRTPLFLGHGTEDEKVSLQLGIEAASCLKVLGMQVSWMQYEGLAHWYSAAMLSDLVDFLQGLDLASASRVK